MKRFLLFLIIPFLLYSCGKRPEETKEELKVEKFQGIGEVETDKFNDAAQKNEDPVEGGDVVISFPSEPDNLSITDNSAYSSRVMSYIYNSLLTRDPETFEWEGSVAKKWIEEDVLILKNGNKKYGSVTESEKGYLLKKDGEESQYPATEVEEVRRGVSFTFYLRKDITFHDGQPLTARDVEFSYQVIRNSDVDAPALRSYYEDLKECEVIDNYTIRLEYAKQYWRARAFAGGFDILPEHLYNADHLLEKSPKKFGERFNNSKYNRQPVGSGPYRFDEWKTGQYIKIRKNDNYWKKQEEPLLKSITFRFITDEVASLQALRNKEIGFLPRMTTEQYVKETNNDKFKKDFVRAEYYTGGFSYVGWNMRRPPFNDRKVRLAMAYGALDRELFLKKVLHNLGVVVTGSQYYYGPAYDHSVKPYPYDPEKASQLLLEAGWFDHDNDGIIDKDGQPFEFELLMSQSSPTSSSRKQAEMMIENLKKLGIRMTVRQLEWATFLENINERKFDACRLGWASSLESDPYQIWHTSSKENRGSNFVGFGDTATDILIEKSRLAIDEKQRRKLFFDFHTILHKEQPYLFLYCTPNLGGYNKKYRGVKLYVVRPGYDLSEWFVTSGTQ